MRGVRKLEGLADCDVLHVVWPGDPSGVVTQVAGIVRVAKARGALVHRVCFLEGRGATADALRAEGLAYRLDLRRGWGPLALWRFALSLRRLNPSVVHFHWPALGPIAIAMAALPRASFVWTEHHPGAMFRSFRFRTFYRVFRTKFSRFVVTSEDMARHVEGYGVEPSRIALIPNGLTIPLRRRPTPDGRHAGDAIGVVTRLDRLKRVDVFIDVIAELQRRGVRCSAFVVGDGGARPRLERHAVMKGVDDSVRFVGMQNDVTQWLDRFDIFLTTTSIESFGLAGLEAMARGVPVVAMPCPGGLADLVASGGILLSDRKVETAADTVEQLLNSSKSHAKVQQRGYDVAARYSMDATVSSLDELYRDVGENGVLQTA